MSQCCSAPSANLPPVNSGPAAGSELNTSQAKSGLAGGADLHHERSKNVQAANVVNSKFATAKPGKQWASLTNDHIRAVVKNGDVDTFLKFDAIGLKEFSWMNSEVAQRQRAGLWSYAHRWGMNPAGMLTMVLGKEHFESADDSDDAFAVGLLKSPPVVAESPLQAVPAEPDIDVVRRSSIADLATLVK